MLQMRRLAGTAALVLAPAMAGCASGGQPGSGDRPFDVTPGSDGTVLLTVQNNDFRDATIIAHWSGVQERAGMVTGKTSETFRLRWRNERIQLEIDFVGGGGYWTESVAVWAGDHLEFVIMPGM